MSHNNELGLDEAMIVLVSLVVLVASLYVVLSGHYDEGVENWAFGTIGAVVGVWVKPRNKPPPTT